MRTFWWLVAVYRARAYANRVLFSKRQAFLNHLRPVTANGRVIAYPDAWLYITPMDVSRAIEAADRVSGRFVVLENV